LQRCGLVRQLEQQSNPRARLTRGVGSVLRHAVEAQQRGGDQHDAVRRSLRSLCRLARSQGILVEHLILICKDVWRTLPEARRLPRDTADAMLKTVIAQCIDEFYRTDGAGVSRTGPSLDVATVPEASLSYMLGPLS
jgi:hypothetical protein